MWSEVYVYHVGAFFAGGPLLCIIQEFMKEFIKEFIKEEVDEAESNVENLKGPHPKKDYILFVEIWQFLVISIP